MGLGPKGLANSSKRTHRGMRARARAAHLTLNPPDLPAPPAMAAACDGAHVLPSTRHCPHPAGWRTPLPEVIDSVVRRCPIDTRRALLGNISLSGGTTMFKHFGQRIQVRADGVEVGGGGGGGGGAGGGGGGGGGGG